MNSRFHWPSVILTAVVIVVWFPVGASSQSLFHPISGDDLLLTGEETDNGTSEYLTEPDSWISESPFQLTWFAGMEGSKQPQDFGANANLGGRGSVNLSGPLVPKYGIGFQIGTAFVASQNASQIFELLNASADRTQSFTTAGVFQRFDNGFAWGAAYDFLSQDSFDNFTLGQWRIRISQQIGENYEIGTTINIGDRLDEGFFNTTAVRVEPMDRFAIYFRKYWNSGAITSMRFGQSSGHNEDNVLFPSTDSRENTFLYGADFFAPLNDWIALYGEANVITPIDTGSVDAFVGLELSTSRLSYTARHIRFRRLFPLASGTTFTSNLSRQ